MIEEKEIQEKILVFRVLQSRLDSIIKQREALASRIIELQTTVNTLDEIKGEDDVLVSLGSSAYVKGKLADKSKVMVEIGAGVVLEKNVEEAKHILENRIGEIQNVFVKIQNEINEISLELERLEPEIQKIADAMNKEQKAG